MARSRSKNRWELWRKEITRKRPFRCRRCAWRGWALDDGTFRRDGAAIRARAPEGPVLKETPFARNDKLKVVDLHRLDTFAQDDETDG